MTARAGETLVTIRKSHAWHWLPRPYRHVSGGYAVHWLSVHVLVHDVESDRQTAEAIGDEVLSRWAKVHASKLSTAEIRRLTSNFVPRPGTATPNLIRQTIPALCDEVDRLRAVIFQPGAHVKR